MPNKPIQQSRRNRPALRRRKTRVAPSRDLLKELVSSETRGALLILFHTNPGLIDTIDGVARRVGKTEPEIKPDLAAFARMGLLRRKRIGRLEVVRLDIRRDKEIQSALTDQLRGMGKTG